MRKGSGAQPSPPHGQQPAKLPLLRPMEVMELLDEAFDLYKRNFRLFFGIAILLNAPITLLTLALGFGSPATAAVGILSVLAYMVSVSALSCAAWDRLMDRETTILTAYQSGLRRLFWVFVGFVLYTLASAVGLVLLVIPGLYVGLCSMLLLPVIVVENPGWAGIVRRPWQIPGENIWRLFFVGLGLSVLALIISSLQWALIGLLVGLSGINPNRPPDLSNGPGMIGLAGYLLVSVLIRSAGTPVFTTAQLLAYVDLRIRRESYDLELLAAAVQQRVMAERGAAPSGTTRPGQVPG